LTCIVSLCGRGHKECRPAASAEALKLAPNTLTFHFDRLRQAGLVTVRREGRSMIYAARYEAMNDLLSYLTENCCAGAPASCASAEGASSRPSRKKERVQ